MLETLNRSLLGLVVAPTDLSVGAFLFAFALAKWAIFVIPATLTLLWIFGDTQDRRAAFGAGLAACIALAFAGAISSFYFHPRPFMDGVARNYLHHAVDSSFPSDHATVLFSIAWSLLFDPRRWTKRLGGALLVLSCAVGWSRIYLGAHYPFDIAGAALLGLATACAMNQPIAIRFRDRVTDVAERAYSFPFEALGKRKS